MQERESAGKRVCNKQFCWELLWRCNKTQFHFLHAPTYGDVGVIRVEGYLPGVHEESREPNQPKHARISKQLI